MMESQSVGPDRGVADETATFLAAVARVLRETVGRLEATVDRVTEMAALRSGQVDRDVVMTLQDFDRLQQEFAAIAAIIEQLADKPGEAQSPAAARSNSISEAIAGISIADLKERLLRQLGGSMDDLFALPATSDEVVF
jgi:hypothetical protein